MIEIKKGEINKIESEKRKLLKLVEVSKNSYKFEIDQEKLLTKIIKLNQLEQKINLVVSALKATGVKIEQK